MSPNELPLGESLREVLVPEFWAEASSQRHLQEGGQRCCPHVFGPLCSLSGYLSGRFDHVFLLIRMLTLSCR